MGSNSCKQNILDNSSMQAKARNRSQAKQRKNRLEALEIQSRQNSGFLRSSKSVNSRQKGLKLKEISGNLRKVFLKPDPYIQSPVNVISSPSCHSTQSSPSQSSGQEPQQLPPNYRQIMVDRYQATLESMAPQDRCDVELFLAGEEQPQTLPECSQSLYAQLLENESSRFLGDYIREGCRGFLPDVEFYHRLRDEAVRDILELAEKKKYKLETVYLAISLFDQIYKEVFRDTKAVDVPKYYFLCTFMAAKFCQPFTPRMKTLIQNLPLRHQDLMFKPELLVLEEQFLHLLDFDFNFASPEPFVDRFARLLDLHGNTFLIQQAHQHLYQSLSKSAFLKFKPSTQAAAALVLTKSIEDGQWQGTDLWSEEVAQLAGIGSQDIQECLNLMSADHFQQVFSQ